MAISLGSLVVDLVAKTGGFIDGMTKAQQEAKNAAKSIKGSFDDLGNAAQSLLSPLGEIGASIGASLGSIGVTMRAVTDSFAPMIKSLGTLGAGIASVTGAATALGLAGAGVAAFAVNGANQLFEMSEKTGVSVEALSALSYAAKQSGVDSEALAGGLEKMNKAVFAAATAPAGAVNAFTRLGVAVKDSSGNIRPTEALLEDLSAKFAGMADGPAKGALAMQVFGRSGTDMLPFLNQGKEGIKGLVDEANELGITLSGKTAAAAHAFTQTLETIEGALQGAANAVLSVMLPSMEALSDFFVNELKDPSASFRQLGTAITEIVVPSFKALASAIAVAVTIGNYFISALTNGIQFASTLVLGLGNAFSDLKTGNFREAGNELKSQFQEGLANFTKGVEDETGKADQRLQKFFASTWFGADTSKPETKKRASTSVDTNPAPNNAVIDQIQKLQQAADAQLKLASATDFSTGALRIQDEENATNANLLQLSEKAHISLADAVKQWGSTVAQAVTTISEGKALESLNSDIAKSIQKMQDHTREALGMASAIRTGGQAVISAQAAIAAQPLIDQIESLQVSMAHAEQVNGKTSASYLGLAASLENAKSQLQAVQQAFSADKQASYTQDLASGFDSLRGKIQALQIEGAAIGGTTDQLREAAVQAQLASFVAAHPGLDTGTAEWAAYADEVERASKAQQENADKAGAQKFDLAGSLKNSIDQLERYRQQLEAAHASTIAVDAAEQDKNRATIQSYDDLILKVGGLKDGLQAAFNQIALSAKTPAQTVYDVFTNAFQGVNDALVKVVTGSKGAFAELGKSIEQSLAKSAVSTLTTKAVGAIGGVFGVKLGASAKRDGNSTSTALFVELANGAKSITGVLGGKTGDNDSGSSSSSTGSNSFNHLTNAFKDIGSKIGDTFKNVFSGIGNIFGKIGGGIGSIFGSLFGGFKAGGGDVSPGKAYVVGEQRPELFVPHAAGRIVPNVAMATASGPRYTTHVHFEGVKDADTFKVSENQILNRLINAQRRVFGR